MSATAVYKGLTLAQMGGVNYLYAANFMAGTVDVFDRWFMPVSLSAWAFHDKNLPSGYAPFNVQNIEGDIYVTYAQKEAGSIDEVHGAGKGYVDVYSPDGALQKRLQHGSWFNAPWGVVKAPADFGRFSNMILVGQFGSGRIAAFDPMSGKFRGLMRGANDRSLVIEGLWALSFGNGANAAHSTHSILPPELTTKRMVCSAPLRRLRIQTKMMAIPIKGDVARRNSSG
jgi:uncharacterized protein (TIGR03118 family)